MPRRCDEPNCPEEAQIYVGAEARCFAHALEKGNADRVARGLSPLVPGDDGQLHPEQ